MAKQDPSKHTHVWHNEVTLVWGSLRLESGMTTHCPCNLNHMITLILPTAQEAPPTPSHQHHHSSQVGLWLRKLCHFSPTALFLTSGTAVQEAPPTPSHKQHPYHRCVGGGGEGGGGGQFIRRFSATS